MIFSLLSFSCRRSHSQLLSPGKNVNCFQVLLHENVLLFFSFNNTWKQHPRAQFRTSFHKAGSILACFECMWVGVFCGHEAAYPKGVRWERWGGMRLSPEDVADRTNVRESEAAGSCREEGRTESPNLGKRPTTNSEYREKREAWEPCLSFWFFLVF